MTQAEHRQLREALAEIFTEEHAVFWLSTPNRHIRGRIPVECSFDEVKKLIEQVKAMLERGDKPAH